MLLTFFGKYASSLPLLLEEWMHMWQMLSDVRGETLFSCRPLLSLCCGLLVGFIPVQDDIIVQAEGRRKEGRTDRREEGRKEGKKRIPSKDAAWNPFIACLHYSAAQERNKAPDQICHTFIPPSPYCWFAVVAARGYSFALADILVCDVCVCFACLQKPNTAMRPCPRSSAAERGRAWKGKAKARKTQVAGKGCSENTHTNRPTECKRLHPPVFSFYQLHSLCCQLQFVATDSHFATFCHIFQAQIHIKHRSNIYDNFTKIGCACEKGTLKPSELLFDCNLDIVSTICNWLRRNSKFHSSVFCYCFSCTGRWGRRGRGWSIPAVLGWRVHPGQATGLSQGRPQ